MNRRVRRAAYLIALILGPSLAGCGAPGPTLRPVSGTVTLDGQPLADGLVYFKTVQTGAVDVMNVKSGEFQGNAHEGDRRVEIYSFRTSEQNFDGMKSPVKENLVAKRYNVESTLTAAVAAGGPNKFHFEVTSK